MSCRTPTWSQHRRLAGLCLICGGAFAEELLHTELERIPTIAGSLLLIASHAANLALRPRAAG